MKGFKTNRKNDAWGTIRGFVYQVDLTIHRWLELKENDVLELERGEDIDLVRPDFEEYKRLLEQIKVREQNLTLRSDSALTALANFHEHSTNNSEVHLKFRYVTNASIGKEKKLGVPADIPLIYAWIRIFKNELTGKELRSYLLSIRSLIGSYDDEIAPSTVNNKSWASFKSFVRNSSNKKLQEFIKNVEWATEQPKPTDLNEELKCKIIDKFKITEDRAASIYQTLFYNVFSILTKPDIKRLTPLRLEEIVDSSHLVNKEEVDKLFQQFDLYHLRIQQLEMGQADATRKLRTLEEQIDQQSYVAEIGFDELREACNKVSKSNAAQIVDNQNTIPRPQFNSEIDHFLNRSIRCLVITGISGAGKSIAIADKTNELIENGWTVLFFAIPPGQNILTIIFGQRALFDFQARTFP